MKKIPLVATTISLLFVVGILLAVGCGAGGGIAGTYRPEGATTDELVLEVNSDGTYTWVEDDAVDTGTYVISGNTVTFTNKDGETVALTTNGAVLQETKYTKIKWVKSNAKVSSEKKKPDSTTTKAAETGETKAVSTINSFLNAVKEGSLDKARTYCTPECASAENRVRKKHQ